LILKNSTFIQAIVIAIKEYATYGLEALNTLLVTTGIKAASVPAVTLAEGQAMTGTKVVIDDDAGTVKVYNSSNVLLNTYTKVTAGNVHTLTRT
jgi:hypothetical protein